VKPSAALVLDALRAAGPAGLSPDDARRLRPRCDRLAPRVHELRREGFDVATRMEPHEGGEHARYVLIEAPRQLEMVL
jgi:hypothetical protein